MTFVSRLNSCTADAVSDLVSPLLQCLVFTLRDRLGVAQRVGGHRSVGVITQDVHINLGAGEATSLLTKTQYLLWLEIQGQSGAIAVTIRAALTPLIQKRCIEIQKFCKSIPKSRPGCVADKARLEIERVGELAGCQHTALAIKQPATDRGTGHQTDAILIGQLPESGPFKQLHPDEATHHGAAEEHHQNQQNQGLLSKTGMTRRRGSGHLSLPRQKTAEILQSSFNSLQCLHQSKPFIRLALLMVLLLHVDTDGHHGIAQTWTD